MDELANKITEYVVGLCKKEYFNMDAIIYMTEDIKKILEQHFNPIDRFIDPYGLPDSIPPNE